MEPGNIKKSFESVLQVGDIIVCFPQSADRSEHVPALTTRTSNPSISCEPLPRHVVALDHPQAIPKYTQEA